MPIANLRSIANPRAELSELELNMLLHGPVLALPNQEGAGASVADISGFGNDGVLTDVSWVRLDSGLWVMSLNGSSSQVLITPVDFSQITSTTILVWLKLNSAPAPWKCLGEYWSTNNNRITFTFDPNGKIGIYYWDSPVLNDVWSDAGLSVDTWYFIALLMGTGGMRMYLQNVLQADIDATTKCFHSLADSTATFRLGRNYDGNYLDCCITLPHIIPGILSPTELTNIPNREKHYFDVFDGNILARLANTRSLAVLR